MCVRYVYECVCVFVLNKQLHNLFMNFLMENKGNTKLYVCVCAHKYVFVLKNCVNPQPSAHKAAASLPAKAGLSAGCAAPSKMQPSALSLSKSKALPRQVRIVMLISKCMCFLESI